MQEEYLAHYKCECFGKKVCNCANKGPIYALFLENIEDIATSLIDVMGICGINQCKSNASFDVVKHAFLHYDEIRYRVDSVPRKRLSKGDLIHDLGRKCRMTRVEAQLAYGIIKRAFKAFYYGTCEGGLRNPILESQMIHSQACLWLHAAKRTAQIFASYAGMFYTAQRNYEAKIRCVYKHLYDRIKGRALPLDMQECSCAGCFKETPEKTLHKKPSKSKTECEKRSEAGVISSELFTNAPPELQPSHEMLSLIEERPQALPYNATCRKPSRSKVPVNSPRCDRCKCPQLICDCNIAREIITTQCSQGPYKCFWMRMDEEEPIEQVVNLPEDHHCPVDCDEASDICESECECDCESCDCATEEHSSDYDYDEWMLDEDEGKEEEDVIEYDPCAPLFTSRLSESEQSSLYEFADHLVNGNRNSATPSEQPRRSKQASFDKTTDNNKLRESVSARPERTPNTIQRGEPARPERTPNAIKPETQVRDTAPPPKPISNHEPMEQITTPLTEESREKQAILDLIGQLL